MVEYSDKIPTLFKIDQILNKRIQGFFERTNCSILINEYDRCDEFIIFAKYLLDKYDLTTMKTYYFAINKFHDKLNFMLRMIERSKKLDKKYDIEPDMEQIAILWSNIIAFIIRFDKEDEGMTIFMFATIEVNQTLANLDILINMDQKSISSLGMTWKMRNILIEEKYLVLAKIKKPKIKIKRTFFGGVKHKKIPRLLLPGIDKSSINFVIDFQQNLLKGFQQKMLLLKN